MSVNDRAQRRVVLAAAVLLWKTESMIKMLKTRHEEMSICSSLREELNLVKKDLFKTNKEHSFKTVGEDRHLRQ